MTLAEDLRYYPEAGEEKIGAAVRERGVGWQLNGTQER
jgi:hypothetical protein